MANLVRKLKAYSDEIKLSIYENLSQRGLRFDSLAEASGRNRVTLTEYLVHGQEESELSRDPRTKEYMLTPKGRDELERLLIEQSRREASFEYHGRIEPTGYSIPPSPTAIGKERYQAVSHMLLGYELPLPLTTTGSIYGSEALKFIQEAEERWLQDLKVSPRRIGPEMLDDLVRRYAEPLVWRFILRRLGMLLEWHEFYGKPSEPDDADWMTEYQKKKPPALTIENILGFDLSMSIRYNGTRLLKSGAQMTNRSGLAERKRAKNILVGATLTNIAYEHPESGQEVGVIDHFRKAGLLRKEEADIINKLEQAMYLPSPSGIAGEHIIDPEKHRIFAERVYEIGWRYLVDAGLIDSKGKDS